MKRELGTLTFEDAQIIFRNFRGLETKYNREGDRNFCVIIPSEELAETLAADGWNVKRLRPREEGDEPKPYLQVSVSYKGRPPVIWMITRRGRTAIGEDMLDLLDFADIQTIDFIVNPYEWSVRGNSGVSAYLKTMFVTLVEDELMLKYADIPEIGAPHRPLAIESGQVWEGEVV